ncbi:MAG: anthranilate phosphoribosyltransferase [Candidatus Omnitrophota bacterium]
MILELTEKLSKGNLTAEEMSAAMKEVMSGQADTSSIVAFLKALNAQGITPDELAGAAGVMGDYVLKINSIHKVILDTCGTGGDKSHTFNISTAAAFVASAAGIAVAKHGNRSVSSKCGSADVLEALGININMGKEIAQKCLDEIGITFLFAPNFHPAMKYAMPARKEIGVKTIFNYLGPLCNPAQAAHQLIGAPDIGCALNMAEALVKLGAGHTKHALVVSGDDLTDEFTTQSDARTLIYEVYEGKLVNSKAEALSAKDFGFKEAQPGAVNGLTVEENARILREILENKLQGPYQDIVLLNAGAALYAAKTEIEPLKIGITNGIELARLALESGKALEKLELLIKYSNHPCLK